MPDAASISERVELFFGGGTESITRVYARLAGPAAGSEWSIAGKLTGPECLYAETLPATFRFVDPGGDGPPLAEALVTEPNLWTPEMPHLYRANLEVRAGDEVLARIERVFGIRPLGATPHGLRLDGKGWVLRGVWRERTSVDDLAAWHAADTVIVVRDPDDALCAAASRVGVLIVAVLDQADAGDVRRLSRWPAVGLVSLPGALRELPRGAGPNLLIGQRFAAGAAIAPADGCDVVMCEVAGDAELPPAARACPLPVIPMRRSGGNVDVAEGRALCDRLQRELAPRGQFAGYIV